MSPAHRAGAPWSPLRGPAHFWGSPLLDVDRSCRTCHADRTAGQLTQRVRDTQERHLEAMEETQERSVRAHYDINRLITAGADEEVVEETRQQVWDEQEPLEKAEWVTNDFFPFQG